MPSFCREYEIEFRTQIICGFVVCSVHTNDLSFRWRKKIKNYLRTSDISLENETFETSSQQLPQRDGDNDPTSITPNRFIENKSSLKRYVIIEKGERVVNVPNY